MCSSSGTFLPGGPLLPLCVCKLRADAGSQRGCRVSAQRRGRGARGFLQEALNPSLPAGPRGLHIPCLRPEPPPSPRRPLLGCLTQQRSSDRAFPSWGLQEKHFYTSLSLSLSLCLSFLSQLVNKELIVQTGLWSLGLFGPQPRGCPPRSWTLPPLVPGAPLPFPREAGSGPGLPEPPSVLTSRAVAPVLKTK